VITYSKWLISISTFGICGFVMAACKPETIVETVEVQVTVEKPVEVEILITSTPESIPQGGALVEVSYTDAHILNPLLSVEGDDVSSVVHNALYLSLLTIDPFTSEIIGEIAESWTVSEDGLIYTFQLRDDIYWTDGIPVTAFDVQFTYDALGSERVNTMYKWDIELIESLNVIDEYTLEVVFNSSDCSTLGNLDIGILPAHKFADDFSDIMTSPLNIEPTVSNGPFKFLEWEVDDHITLVRNENYYLGAPNLESWTIQVIANESTALTAFLAEEVDLALIPPQYVSVLDGEIAKGSPFEAKKLLTDSYFFIGLNMANSKNPQIGWVDDDEEPEWDEGELHLEQDPHPILGDKLVRQAIAYSIDYTKIINTIAFGQGSSIVANVLPGVKWAYNKDLEPYALNPDKSAAILEEAGWIDNDFDGVREKDDEPLKLTIMTNYINETRMNIGLVLKDNLEELGFEITLDYLERGTVFDRLFDQEFDIVILHFSDLSSNPDDSIILSYRYDDPGRGTNFVSYYNEQVEEKIFKALSMPGCSIEERGQLYKDVQTKIHEDVPYVFIYNPLRTIAWNTRLQGVNPGSWDSHWNIHEWFLIP